MLQSTENGNAQCLNFLTEYYVLLKETLVIHDDDELRDLYKVYNSIQDNLILRPYFISLKSTIEALAEQANIDITARELFKIFHQEMLSFLRKEDTDIDLQSSQFNVKEY